MPRISDAERTNPHAYARVSGKLTNLVLAKKINRNDWKAMSEALAQACKAHTGIALEQALMKQRDAIRSFMGLMETGEEGLLKLKSQIDGLDDKRVTEKLKKKWNALIDMTLALQGRARDDAAAFMVYVGRDEDPKRAGEIFEMSGHHLRYFDTWNDVDQPHSVIEAPPGHGKSVCLKYQQAWETGKDPALRCLYLTDEKGKAADTVMSLKAIIRSDRFKAVFPEIRVLGRMDNARDTSCQFTVARMNEFARDATVFAAGILSRIQGKRFDRIYIDDVCTPEVRDHRTIRDNTNAAFFGVVKTRVADAKNTRIRVIGTPWHPDDVLGKIVDAVRKGQLNGWRVEIDPFRIKDDKDGNPIPIWDKFDAAFFRQQQVLDGRNYDLNYRLQPCSESSQAVSRVYWYNSRPDSRLSTDKDIKWAQALAMSEKWLSIDPAGTDQKYSSDTGAVEIILATNGYAHVSRTWAWHCTMDEVIEKVKQLILEAPMPGYTGVHWEAQGAIKGPMHVVIKELRRLLVEGGCLNMPQIISTGTMVGGVSQNRGKLARLQACSNILAYGAVRFAGERKSRYLSPGDKKAGLPTTSLGPIDGSRMESFAESIKHFDGTTNADMVDALTQWILHNSHKLKSPFTPKTRVAPVEDTDPFTACFRKQVETNSKPKSTDDRHNELRIFAA